MVDDHGEASAVGLLESLRQARTVEIVFEARVDARGKDGEVAHRSEGGRPVNDAHLDRVGADSAGIDIVVAAGAEDGVEAGDDISQRLDVGCILQLVEAESVRVEADDRLEQFVALARELARLALVSPSALEVGVAAAVIVSKLVGAG